MRGDGTVKKYTGQILSLCAVVLVFAILNLAIYNIFTYRCISRYSEGMQAKSVELGEYLPFDEGSKIVDRKSELTIKGELPVIDGAAAFYPVFSAFVNSIYPEDSVEFDGENFVEGSALQYSNTRGAYRAIVDGDIDIAICLQPSEEQRKYAEDAGVSLTYVPIAREAFVFLVNEKNPVDSLSTEEIKGIYTGKYNNWRELGGENKPIGALHRNAGSGSQTTMLDFMGEEKIKTDYDSFLGSAIGFSFRFYVEGVVGEGSVKLLSVDGVYPNADNIRNGSYPIVKEIYAVYRTDDDNENIETVIDWMLSDEGQSIIEDTGYVGIK